MPSKPTRQRRRQKARQGAEKERRGQLWQAFQMQRKQDKSLLPLHDRRLLRRCRRDGPRPAAHGWPDPAGGSSSDRHRRSARWRHDHLLPPRADQRVQAGRGHARRRGLGLQNNLRGKWRVTPGVAGTSQLDAVHRVVGRPGVMLVGEGAPHRVKPLLAQEKKRIARVVGEPRSTTSSSATRRARSRCGSCNNYMMKLPRNISVPRVATSTTGSPHSRSATPRPALPKGPMPGNVKMPQEPQRPAGDEAAADSRPVRRARAAAVAVPRFGSGRELRTPARRRPPARCGRARSSAICRRFGRVVLARAESVASPRRISLFSSAGPVSSVRSAAVPAVHRLAAVRGGASRRPRRGRCPGSRPVSGAASSSRARRSARRPRARASFCGRSSSRVLLGHRGMQLLVPPGRRR